MRSTAHATAFLFAVLPLGDALMTAPSRRPLGALVRFAQTSAQADHMSEVEEMCQAVSKGAKLIDVREPAEYAAAHFKSSMSAPLSSLERGIFPEDRLTAVGVLLNEKLYVMGDDMRAAKAAAILVVEMNYEDVTPLAVSFETLAGMEIDEILSGAPPALTE